MFQNRFSKTDQHSSSGTDLAYELQPRTTSKTKYSNDKTKKRSLDVNPKSNRDEDISFSHRKQQPNYSAFSGLSSFASFNLGGNHNMPQSKFSCRSRVPGYYADIELGCKVSGQLILLNKTKC